MTRCWPLSVLLMLLIGLLPAASPARGASLPAAPGYVITDLGSLGGGQTFPVAINVRGDVAGYSTTADGKVHAFFLPANGPMQDLGDLGGDSSYPLALNNRGDVVGYAVTAAGQRQLFVRFDNQNIDLGLEKGVTSQAVGLNDSRQVLVVQDAGDGKLRSLLWQNAQTTPLGDLGGGSTAAASLNHLGQVVGSSRAADGSNHAFAFDSVTRQLMDLGTLGAGGGMTAVNEIGQAVGIRTTATGATIAVLADLSTEGALVADLIVRRGYSGTLAFGINNESTIAGAGELSTGAGTNAGVWTADGQFLKLNETALVANSGWVLQSANAINDAGVVVGRALGPGGQQVAYMLMTPGQPVPADKAVAMANSLNPAIEAITKAAENAAKAAAPSALSTAVVALQQARSLLTPAAGETAVSGVSSGQASHLLTSAVNLLTIPDNSAYLSPADRDAALAILAEARKGFQ
jgi:probable HAF family extracellular repeat protein